MTVKEFLGGLGGLGGEMVSHGGAKPCPALSRIFLTNFFSQSRDCVYSALARHLMRKREEEAIEIGHRPCPL